MRRLKKDLWPHCVPLNEDYRNDITKIEIWLGNQLGTFRGRWNVVYEFNHTDFYFRHEQDAVLFALRWA